MGIGVGSVQLRNRVILAPMSGVTDAAFRMVAAHCGAGLVVSEMVASEELVRSRPDMMRRTKRHPAISPFVIQLAGRETKWMAEGARLAEQLGADIIDINMGCPARQVTGGLSGSALMRDPDHALKLVEATVSATKRPVTLKMRLGWDHSNMNAPEIAKKAADAGIQMITVHGRTRCQFYTGRADWTAIRAVRNAIKIPLVANGDGATINDARDMMEHSGADAVMFGRSCYGRPWWPGVVANDLNPSSGRELPTLADEVKLITWQHEATLSLYGNSLGNKVFRKHFGWTLERLCERGLITKDCLRTLRGQYLCDPDNTRVIQVIHEVYSRLTDTVAIGREAA